MDPEALSAELAEIGRPVDRVEAGRTREAVRNRLFGRADRVAVGRFRIDRTLGRGGEGLVLLAQDPAIGRPVALKKLVGGVPSAAARARLRQEARTLARLSDPHIVQIYDAVVADGELFVVMEYVEGPTLRDWLREDRDPAAILAALLDAGAGLAAAHARGIVHGDFKPDNVLVGDDGRVRVADLGLAHACDDAAATDAAQGTSGDRTRPSGTPGYIAPERSTGAPPTVASDQYAFCATIHEALSGRLPEADTPASGIRVPRHVRAAMWRGLAPDPAARWPSMHALLAALRGRPRRRWVFAGGVLAAAVVVAALWPGGDRTPCAGADRIEDAWPDEARAAIAALYDEATAERVSVLLDASAAQWSATYKAVCADGGPASDPVLACLRSRRTQLQQAVDVVVQGTAPGRAIFVAHDLTPPARCGEDVSGQPESDDVVAFRAELSRARTLEAAGRFDEAFPIARQLLAQLPEGISAPVRDELAAAALLRLASIEHHLGRAESSAEHAARAADLATAIGDDDLLASAAAGLVFTHGYVLAHPEDAERWSRFGAAALERGRMGPLPRARLETSLGAAAYRREAWDEAVAHHAEALRLRRETLAPEHPDIAMSLSNLAFALERTGDATGALERHREAFAIREAALGPDHHYVASSLMGVGNGLVERDPAGARSAFERALKIRSQIDPEGPFVGGLHLNLANVCGDLGDFAAAEQHLAHAEAVLGARPESAPKRWMVHAARGSLLHKRGDHEQAVVAFRRAIAAKDRPSSRLATVWRSLAATQDALGRLDEAAASRAEAAAIDEH